MIEAQVAQPKPGKLFIGGAWRDAASGKTFDTVNPATGKVLTQVAEGDAADIDRAVEAADAAFPGWAALQPGKRSRILGKVSDLILKSRDELAELEILDQGKVHFEATKVDVPMAADAFHYFAGWATKLGGRTLENQPGFLNYTLSEPYGVVGQIIPWNFPLLMAAWKLAPALAAGESCSRKRDSRTAS